MERYEDPNRMHMETEKSVVTEANSKDFFRPPEKVGLGFQMGEPTSMEWTDEKHSLYLNFMEASFVNQLYNREYSSMDSSGWLSRGHEQVGSGPSRSNPSNPSSSDQFKVLRSGCWQKLDFERARSQQDLGDESRVLMANPWVRHFRSSINGKGTEVTSPNLQENDMSVCNDTQFEGQKHTFTTLGVATYSKPPTIYCKDFDFQSTEVSDQNFVDESSNCKGDQLNSSCGKKRVRNATANLSSKDQVVPFSNSDPSSKPSRKKKDQKCKQGQTYNANTFIYEASGSSSFEEQ